MVDLGETIQANSNQLNADDLIGYDDGFEITLTDVASGGTKEQPIVIHYENEDGKPWKPCKTMRRVMVNIWGRDGKTYIGKKLKLYRDPEVTYGGQKVGGIRISHASGIDKAVTMSLTASSKSKKPITIQPLKTTQAKSAYDIKKLKANLSEATDMEQLKTAWLKIPEDARKQLEAHKEQCKKAINEKAQPATSSEPADEPDIP